MDSDRMNIDDALYQRIQDDLADSFDEELEMEADDQVLDAKSSEAGFRHPIPPDRYVPEVF